MPSGDVAQGLDRALDVPIQKLEQRRFAATARSRPGRRRATTEGRHVPAAIRRTVGQRDGGRCTFVGSTGRRCEARTRFGFDHLEPYARGGHATVAGFRLRCRAHNQFAAECVFGTGFMQSRRQEARRRRDEVRGAARAPESARARAAGREREATRGLEAARGLEAPMARGRAGAVAARSASAPA